MSREPRDCPKYDTCSAPLCPLDTHWYKRAVAPNEPVCVYLLELDKDADPIARFSGRYDEFVIAAAVRLREAIANEAHPRYSFLARRIAAAGATPSMIERAAVAAANLKRAREARKEVYGPEISHADTVGTAEDVPAPTRDEVSL